MQAIKCVVVGDGAVGQYTYITFNFTLEPLWHGSISQQGWLSGYSGCSQVLTSPYNPIPNSKLLFYVYVKYFQPVIGWVNTEH